MNIWIWVVLGLLNWSILSYLEGPIQDARDSRQRAGFFLAGPIGTIILLVGIVFVWCMTREVINNGED